MHLNIYKYQMLLLAGVTVILLFSSCQKQNSSNNEIKAGLIYPKTETVNESDYGQINWVAKNGQDQQGAGSKEKPYLSIPFALTQIKEAAVDNKAALFIAGGEYTRETIVLKEYVDLYGGFNDQTWQRDIEKYRSVLSGEGDRRILVAANYTTLDGFYITEGEIKGKGAGLYCDGTSPVISNNVFSDNKTKAPDNWNPKYWHETANDGGAIFGENGSSAIIKNNIFVNNETENGRGAAISFDGKCKPIITENVFLSNTTGLKDPMRSSDGGAINIFDWSDAIIEGNVFVSNRAESKNDAGAVFIALWSSAEVTNNLFVDSHAGDDAGALFVGGQEHRYDGPLDPIPAKEDFFVSIKGNTFIGNHHGGSNSGAMRFTMESRGEFINNILAQNSGVYFQRSEVHVADNLIMDNFLFIETKEGLDKGIIENNLLWAGYDQQVDADVKNNNMRYPLDGNGNYSKEPQFVDDGMMIASISTNYVKDEYVTLVHTTQLDQAENQLVNRAFRAGQKWGVIKSNTVNSLTVWGDFGAEVNFTLMPTYSLKSK